MIPGHSIADATLKYAARFPRAFENGFYRVAQGHMVSTLGLGTYLGQPDPATDAAYTAAIQAAIAGGINFLDTSINYRNQHSERAMGEAIRAAVQEGTASREELFVATKAGFLTPGAIPDAPKEVVGGMHSMHPDYLVHQMERSRQNLDLETIDLFYLHNPETQLRFVTRPEFDDRVRRAFTTLERAVVEGKILYYGTATWSGYRVRADNPERLDLKRLVSLAQDAGGEDHHFRFVQLPVSLAMPEAFTLPYDQDHDDSVSLMEVAVRAGLSVIASASLLQARLASGLPEDLAAKLPGPTTDAQRAIQFSRSTPGLTTALVGMSNPDHVQENLGVASFPPASVEQFLSLFQRPKP